ncbi:hypothetical protein J6590_076891 [Homalodisca vitripennis]|nr:hypothetical protein J6590_076891 [Homalodisca vitripennis]
MLLRPPSGIQYSREAVTRVDFLLFYNSIRRSRSRLFPSLPPFRKTRKRAMEVQNGSEESSLEMSAVSVTQLANLLISVMVSK